MGRAPIAVSGCGACWAAARRPPLGCLVDHVIARRPLKQVVRVDTGRIVTMVTDQEGWISVVAKEERDSVRPIADLPAINMDEELAVTGGPLGSSPCPAVAGLVNMRPVSLNICLSQGGGW